MTSRAFASFATELQKIAARRKIASEAVTGGLIGAGLGAVVPGGGIKTTLIGGALGTAAGGTLGMAKRVIEPNHQRSAYLASLPPPGDPNYVPTWQQGYQ